MEYGGDPLHVLSGSGEQALLGSFRKSAQAAIAKSMQFLGMRKILCKRTSNQKVCLQADGVRDFRLSGRCPDDVHGMRAQSVNAVGDIRT